MISLSWQMFGHGSSKIGVKTLENTEVAIKNGQSRETVNIKTKKKTQNKKTTQNVLDTTLRNQTQIA